MGLRARYITAVLFPPLPFYGAAEGVTDGETECGDDEDVKCATFTHSLLYCLSLQEWREGGSGKQTAGYKDRGLRSLRSLIQQPIGLDRIHQLPRMHGLPPSSSSFPPTLHLSILPYLPTCYFSVSQFSLPFSCPPPHSLSSRSLPFILSLMWSGDG